MRKNSAQLRLDASQVTNILLYLIAKQMGVPLTQGEFLDAKRKVEGVTDA
jgi:conjugal transfer/entry exclusion protein